MSLPITDQSIKERCARLAQLIADNLAARQTPDGNFKLPEFYAKAFAINLWTRIDPAKYAKNIRRAWTALTSEAQGKRYHREFIEYALLSTPGMNEEKLRQVLCTAPKQSPDVANWQVLGLINRQMRCGTAGTRAINFAHDMLIRARYWRSPLFLDRPNCFSSQYHAFCAALFSDSNAPSQWRLGKMATKLLAELSGTHGYSNLLGRGAGQSFGVVCTLFALQKHGYTQQAEAILFRLEDAFLQAGEMPLNLLAPNPLPDEPGPANPETPGWYSYNRHDDYLAFAGYWLCRTAELPDTKRDNPATPQACDNKRLLVVSTPFYQTQMACRGREVFDFSPAPVVMSGQAESAQILLPPTGGEQDHQSLYDAASVPLPAIGNTEFSRIFRMRKLSQNQAQIDFKLGGANGIRTITCNPSEITIQDRWKHPEDQKADLFRILIDGRIKLVQTSANTISASDLGVTFSADAELKLEPNGSFSAAGPANRITAPASVNATLKILWENADA
ncbi:MAG: hypothetical protein ACMZ66_07925 [Thalassospira sp.]|uniref:hypothetical protein n=1 Tax=Thalassospira sp. TaxID=1912094 RepID=UPI003A89FDA3